MPRNNRTRKNNGTGAKRLARSDQVVDLLKRIASSEDQSRNRMEPDILDVPKIMLSQKRTFTTAYSYSIGPVTGNSTTETQGAISFALANAQDYTSWTNVFDAYRILQVVVEFIPGSIGLTGTSNVNGSLYTAIDYDDSTMLPASSLIQYDTLQVVSAPTFFERRLVPRVAQAAYSGALFNGYAQKAEQWISTNSPSVQHYGLKYSQSITSSAVTTYAPIVTLIVQFRNSH